MEFGSKKISIEEVKVPFHQHPLIPFTRFASSLCMVCNFGEYVYGGYRCNELGCDEYVIHKECAELLPQINHSLHPDHPLKLVILDLEETSCSFCGSKFKGGRYCCSKCDFNLHLSCAKIPYPFVLPANSYGHEHPLVCDVTVHAEDSEVCKECLRYIYMSIRYYRCHQCDYVVHVDCLDFCPEGYHTAHPQHQLKSLKDDVPDYADEECLLCKVDFDDLSFQLHHCDICNFSICRPCMINPPPVSVKSLTTHEHQLHLVPRRIEFTCNACGQLGDRSPYFCLPCNFMIHRECIDLPRVININRHDHRISYNRNLGHGEWKCRVCRKKVDGFYGGYTCFKCPGFVVHSRCAIRADVWDKRELEGIPEEEEIPPFEVIDDNTIKHFSHDHNLQINKDGRHGQMLPETIVCEACVLQILSEPFYSCKQCDFILHEKCANHPRKKRHMRSNQQFTLQTDSCNMSNQCRLCSQHFTGFRYENNYVIIDVRCAAISDTIEHGSHQHPLYYTRHKGNFFFKCDECDYILETKYAHFREKVMKSRYEDHPLLLYFGDKDVDGEYWCEACETKVDPTGWFYGCNDCNTKLHITCVVGDFSYIMPGARGGFSYKLASSFSSWNKEVISNTSICRPICSGCKLRCKLSTILKLSKTGVVVYFCSFKCSKINCF